MLLNIGEFALDEVKEAEMELFCSDERNEEGEGGLEELENAGDAVDDNCVWDGEEEGEEEDIELFGEATSFASLISSLPRSFLSFPPFISPSFPSFPSSLSASNSISPFLAASSTALAVPLLKSGAEYICFRASLAFVSCAISSSCG